MARRARKYGLALVTITQRPGDFLESAHGQAVLANATIKLLLKQDSSRIGAVGEALGSTSGSATRWSTPTPARGCSSRSSSAPTWRWSPARSNGRWRRPRRATSRPSRGSNWARTTRRRTGPRLPAPRRVSTLRAVCGGASARTAGTTAVWRMAGRDGAVRQAGRCGGNETEEPARADRAGQARAPAPAHGAGRGDRAAAERPGALAEEVPLPRRPAPQLHGVRGGGPLQVLRRRVRGARRHLRLVPAAARAGPPGGARASSTVPRRPPPGSRSRSMRRATTTRRDPCWEALGYEEQVVMNCAVPGITGASSPRRPRGPTWRGAASRST